MIDVKKEKKEIQELMKKYQNAALKDEKYKPTENKMMVYRTDKIAEPEKILKLKKKLDKIGNRYKDRIGKEINAYAKKIGFSMLLNVIIDLKLVGKTKDEVNYHS